ncbi:TlpA family protein disulfide reductase [Cohnella terricola]|uniref:Redoxin domain-containing protein n=1 Tax=Cohnella terricola TaxID=1289167 RepID=A0A559JQD1_9BACL|nr:redoxin family protein [Cohnella terricola]TVY02085.1 redoxin domain-containing protein [Cohnella terricola]
MKISKQLIKYALAAVVLLPVLSACGIKETMQGSATEEASMTSSGKTNKGETAPSFSLSDLNGNQVQLADFKGQKVYVKYWASWCSICLAGLEDLNTLAGQDNGFQVVTIVTPNYKGEKSANDFIEWFTNRSYDNITVLLDEGGVWAKKYGLRGYPSSYYIGSDGILVKSSPGHASNDMIVETFKEIT